MISPVQRFALSGFGPLRWSWSQGYQRVGRSPLDRESYPPLRRPRRLGASTTVWHWTHARAGFRRQGIKKVRLVPFRGTKVATS